MPDTKPAQCRIFLSCLALVPLSCPVETRRSHDDVQMIRPCPIKQRSRVRRFFFTQSSRDAGKQGDHKNQHDGSNQENQEFHNRLGSVQ